MTDEQLKEAMEHDATVPPEVKHAAVMSEPDTAQQLEHKMALASKALALKATAMAYRVLDVDQRVNSPEAACNAAKKLLDVAEQADRLGDKMLAREVSP